MRRHLVVPIAAATLLVFLVAVLIWRSQMRIGAGPVPIDPRAPLQPAKQYVVRFWDYWWPVAPDGTTYEKWLRDRLAEFRQSHPNIRVEYRLLEWETGESELAKAIRQGHPPDVYATLPGGATLYSRELQVPARLYLARPRRRQAGEESMYLAASWNAAAVDGTIWAWPRYLAAQGWLASRPALIQAGIDPDRIARLGWSRTEAARALSRLPAGITALLVNPTTPAALTDLMAAAGIPAAFGPDGSRLWTKPALTDAAGWLGAMQAAGLLPPRSAATGESLVDQLLRGRAVLLAGANPWLTGRILKLDRSGRLVMLVPIPGREGEIPPLPLSAAQLVVFRQRDYAGDDHTRAAAELARFLSRAGHPWALPDTPLFPAYLPTWQEWAKAARHAAGRFLLGYGFVRGSTAPGRPAGVTAEERRWLADEVQPALTKFWAGKADAATLADRLGVEPPPPAGPRRPWWRRLIDRLPLGAKTEKTG